MKLFFSPGACSMAPHIIINELKLNVESIRVDLKTKTAGSLDFKKINPKGYVPALQLDNGELLTEGVAIMQYLADQSPESGLAPKFGTFDRYRLMEWLNFLSTEIHKGFSILWNAKMPEEAKAIARDSLSQRFNLLQERLEKNPFLLGSNFTIADAYLFTILGWSIPIKLDLKPWPVLLNYLEKIRSRPAVKLTLEQEGLLKAA